MGDYNSVFTVDLSIIKNNYQRFASQCGTRVIPVLKSDAYGYGAVAVARALTEAFSIEMLAVAQVSEGIELREAGIETAILLLSGTPRHLFEQALRHRLTPTVYCTEGVDAFGLAARKLGGGPYPVHLKIETGLNRLGVRPGEELSEMILALQRTPELTLTGVYSHLISGETMDMPLAEQQFEQYTSALRQLEAAGIDPGLRHFCNSGGAAWFDKGYLDAVRIGRGLYMGDPASLSAAPCYFDPAVAPEAGSWQCTITSIKTVAAGEGIGYGHKFIAKRDMQVAVLCVGYGDGLNQALAATGCPVLIGDSPAPLISACMDQSYVDVTGIPCHVGDVVTLFGQSPGGKRLSSQALADAINDEGVLLTDGLTRRVERVYQ